MKKLYFLLFSFLFLVVCNHSYGQSVIFHDSFEGLDHGWYTNSLSQWEKGTPTTTVINSARSGSTTWATKLNSDYTANDTSVLYAPVIRTTGFDSARVSFWHFLDMEHSDGGYVQLRADTGNWFNLGYIMCPQGSNWYNQNNSGLMVWTDSNSGWIQSSYELNFRQMHTGYHLADSIQFRFVFVSDASASGNGWALDDFEFAVYRLKHDVGITDILMPDSSITNVMEYVTVRIHNFGTDTMNNIPLAFRSTNMSIPVSEISTTAILPDSSIVYTFASGFLPPDSVYALCAFTHDSTDFLLNNNEYCIARFSKRARLDAGVTEIIEPGDTSYLSVNPTVKLRIMNFGSDTLTNIPVQFVIASQTNPAAIWTGRLAPGDSTIFQFPVSYVSPIGHYTACAKTLLPNDAIAMNDEVCKTIIGSTLPAPDTTDAIKTVEAGFSLSQNQPNPSEESTTIAYELDNHSTFSFRIVTVTGQEVYSLEKTENAGKHALQIDTQNFPAGTYFYTMEINGYQLSHKMLVR